jgi:hypothetical protein
MPSLPTITSRTESMAIRLATSPASAPPMPSETTRHETFVPISDAASLQGFSARQSQSMLLRT